MKTWVALTLLLAATIARADDAPVVQAGPTVDTGAGPLRERPLWELGLGVSGLRLPHYRGSDQSRGYVLPLPYVIYRGKWLKADREGARALLFDSTFAKLDVSFGASAPVDSGDNRARQGMPDLPANLEVGPSLNLTLANAPKEGWKLDLRLPVRAAVTLQRSPKYVGVTFSPNLNLDLTNVGGWNVGLLTGPLFADRKYHAQYYGVDAAYATADRPAYAAKGGYAGWQALASTSRRYGNAWVGAFVRYEDLHGAAYDDSPLMRRSSALTAGFGVSWVLWSSEQTVVSTD